MAGSGFSVKPLFSPCSPDTGLQSVSCYSVKPRHILGLLPSQLFKPVCRLCSPVTMQLSGSIVKTPNLYYSQSGTEDRGRLGPAVNRLSMNQL